MSTSAASARWQGSFDGSGEVAWGAGAAQSASPGASSTALDRSLDVSLPREHGGSGAAVSPEELLAGAVASCFVATLGIVLDKQSIVYSNMRAAATLSTDAARPPSITHGALALHITTDHDAAVVRDLAEKAKKFCVIGRALAPSIAITLDIHVEAATATHAPVRRRITSSVSSNNVTETTP